ncbi:hypothetical protein NL108_017915 [Boleophthalmus pectinirostris]|nr:hypothetical protein NL108_017915 [Boleophthalmus pectinirostris]
MEALRDSYKLNGLETQQAWMAALGSNWSHVRGDWDPSGTDGKSLKHDAQDLTVRIQALAERTKTRYKKLANYSEISRTKQKEDEKLEDFKIRMTKVFKTHSGLEESDDTQGPYQQQLKNALHAGGKTIAESRKTVILSAPKTITEKQLVSFLGLTKLLQTVDSKLR